jgi:hypothetical protein
VIDTVIDVQFNEVIYILAVSRTRLYIYAIMLKYQKYTLYYAGENFGVDSLSIGILGEFVCLLQNAKVESVFMGKMFNNGSILNSATDETMTSIVGQNEIMYSFGALMDGSGFFKKGNETSSRITLTNEKSAVTNEKRFKSKPIVVCDNVLFAIFPSVNTVGIASVNLDDFSLINEQYNLFPQNIETLSFTCFSHIRDSVLITINSNLYVVDKSLNIRQKSMAWNGLGIEFIASASLFEALISIDVDIKGWSLNLHDFSVFEEMKCNESMLQCLLHNPIGLVYMGVIVVMVTFIFSLGCFCLMKIRNKEKILQRKLEDDSIYKVNSINDGC